MKKKKKMGMDFSVASPNDYLPQAYIVEKAKEIAKETGAKIELTTDPVVAVKDADVIYTDVWASMGQEEEQEKRLQEFADYQINQQLLKHAKSDYTFMHCLPAHRGEEVTAEIIDGDHSVVFQEAENRLHAQKALMVALMAD